MSEPGTSQRGRPRGSGRTVVVPAVELTQREAVPFAAGRRAAALGLWGGDDEPPTIDQITPHLTPSERRALLADTDETFTVWFGIGMMQWFVEHTIMHARNR